MLSGWVSDKKSICRGRFIGVNNSDLIEKSLEDTITFDAKKSSIISKYNVSYLSGDVVIKYNNNTISANKACFYSKKGEGNIAYAEGKVVFSRKNLLVLADSVLWYAKGGEYLSNAFFKLDAPSRGVGAGWGIAQKIWSPEAGSLSFVNSSYSYCAVDNPDWVLDAGYLEIDTLNKQGFASNLYFKFFGVPIFYFPLFSFPLSPDRKSGFLYPKINYSDTGGWN